MTLRQVKPAFTPYLPPPTMGKNMLRSSSYGDPNRNFGSGVR